MQVDVSVLDKNRKPVHGLTTADFTVLEDGKPRPIVAFSPVDLPQRDAQPAQAAWLRDVAPDLATNALPEEGRVVVILMDRSIPVGQPVLAARKIALAAIDELGPGDLAAVLYTGKGVPQNLTSDRARLLSALNHPDPGWEISEAAQAIEASVLPPSAALNSLNPLSSGQCYCGLCVLEAITQVADSVRDVARRRKSLLFIGSDITVQASDPADDIVLACGFRVKRARETMFRALDLANLTVHSFDPSGLETLAGTAGVRRVPEGRASANLARQGNLQVLPARTGGRTQVNDNEPWAAMPEVFRESDSYYLLGFQPAVPATDGRFHDIQVKVNRRGVDVHARRDYLAPAGDAPSAPAIPGGVRSPGLLEAISGAVAAPGIPLEVSVAPFAQHGKEGATVAIMLALRQDPRTTVNVLAAAFDRNGKSVVSQEQTVSITSAASASSAVSYEVFSQLPVKPGRYEIRIAASVAGGPSGSVYTYVDVPNFAKEPLSLSGAVVEAIPAAASAPADAFADFLAIVPTARREFARTDRAAVWIDVHQGGSGAPQPVSVTVRTVDELNAPVVQGSLVMLAERFAASRAADCRTELPLARLSPGQYLVTITATQGGFAARRNVRFTVR